MSGEHLHSVVLAGGEGERLRPLVEEWLGRHQPKQYCTFTGSRSMFQHTVDRTDALTPNRRRVVVAAESHRGHVLDALRGRGHGHIQWQPRNRGTAAGILLPLSFIDPHDPEATVLIVPSDHFVHPETRFVGYLRELVSSLERHPDKVLLVGCVPLHAESDYGWVEPDNEPVSGLYRVRRFVEKPKPAVAREAMARGALWNILVLAARVSTLKGLYRALLPDTLSAFEAWQSTIGTSRERDVLQELYEVLPAQDFSHEVLQRATSEFLVSKLDGVLWSDWGRPERIRESLELIGREPAFPKGVGESRVATT